MNALYWLGEVYSLQGQKKEASWQFKSVVDNYPQGSKAADALLKLALIHAETGKLVLARQELQDVQKRYPNSSAAGQALVKLKAI